MLFESEKLHSMYDFGNEPQADYGSISSLCKEISRVSSLINVMLEAKEVVCLSHGDITNSNKKISPGILIGDVLERDEISLQNIVYRDPRNRDDKHTAISYHLQDMGISEPPVGTNNYYKYLQLLYFFYMMRYFVYPQENLFLILKEKRRSTYFVPDKRAAGGDYWYFIISNLLDDRDSALAYLQRDVCFTTTISSLATKLEETINEEKYIDDNEDEAKRIRNIISEVASIPIENNEDEDPIEQALDMAYQYQMLAYSGDMIKNLGGDKNPFQFGELEYELPSEWKHRYIRADEIENFMKERETLVFCFQEDKDYVRPEKYIRRNAFLFVKQLIAYDDSLAQSGQLRLFTIESNKDIFISADVVAIIVKTFLDIDEKLKMIYTNGYDWKQKQSLQRALSTKKTLITDLAIRLFVVAFHSEYLNVYQGYGYYYPLFKCIYLNQYLLLQEMVFASFSGNDCGVWARRLKILLEKI